MKPARKTSRYFIGMDCGGTRTVAVLSDKNREILARAAAGPGNPLSAGMGRAARPYRAAIRQLLEQVGCQPHEIRSLGAGVAGAGAPSSRAAVLEHLQRELPGARVAVATDALIAHLGALSGEPGIVAVAGTGSMVLGRLRRGGVVRAGGWGALLGDEGSAADMGREAIRAMLRAEDGREPPTSLKQTLLEHFEVSSPAALVARVQGDPPKAFEYAALYPKLLSRAEEGDALSRRIVSAGARALVEQIQAVARRMGVEAKRFRLALVGGVLDRPDLLRRSVLRRLKQRLPRAVVVEPAAPPEVGALYLALGQARAD